MKKIIILFLFMSLLPFSTPISEDPYCYMGSDYFIFTYENFVPEFTALYDNTQIYFDINSDGVWEYTKTIDEFETLKPDISWKLKDWSYVHSSKPIGYNQKLFELASIKHPTSYGYACIPPISSLRNELILPGLKNYVQWKLMSKDATITIIDGNNNKNTFEVNNSLTIDTTYSLTEDKVWYVNSTKPIIAIARNGFVGRISNDFFKTAPGITRIAVNYDDTTVSIDQNGDGIFDETKHLNRGLHEYSLTAGSRIKSNKNIGVFETQEKYASIYTRDYSLAIPAKSINDENFMKAHEKNMVYFTGIFNDDLGFQNTSIHYEDKNYSGYDEVEPNNIKMFESVDATRFTGDKPLLAFYNYNDLYYRFQRGYQTIEPYISSFSKVKFLGLDDNAIINVRGFNPTIRTLNNVKINIKFIDFFLDSEIIYYLSIKNLESDSARISSSKNVITPLNLGGIRDFTIDVGTLYENEYVSIDYHITTPNLEGLYVFPPATMTFDSEIWNIN